MYLLELLFLIIAPLFFYLFISEISTPQECTKTQKEFLAKKEKMCEDLGGYIDEEKRYCGVINQDCTFISGDTIDTIVEKKIKYKNLKWYEPILGGTGTTKKEKKEKKEKKVK